MNRIDDGLPSLSRLSHIHRHHDRFQGRGPCKPVHKETRRRRRHRRAQSTVDFPIGDHVNVLSDYKLDLRIKFRQKSISQALLKCMHVF